jgi:hypothetical protein
MNTPITEAQYQLAHEIRQSSYQQKAAQLIADSEARAIATQLEVVVILTRRWLNVEKERDELRAEMERLRDDRDCEKRLRKAADEFRENANARAERAEAELATERARLDHVLRNDWPFRDRKEIDAAMKEGVK